MDSAGPAPRAISIAILAMGGEGGGVLSDWLIDMAERAGLCVQSTSVPGVAQRTGATIYYVEIFPASTAREPVLALMPVPGDVDLVVASELMEAGRAIQRGLVTPSRTTLIASTHRVYSMAERTAMADGRVDSDKLLIGAKAAAKRLLAADFARIADENGSVISAALFGALAASASLPFARADFESAIQRSGLGVEASLKAFARAYESATSHEVDSTPGTGNPAPELPDALRTTVASFPAETRSTIAHGCARLIDYQDTTYALHYLERLKPFANDGKVLDETARHLALWMSYEDIARVADLKVRRDRFERVAKEVRASEGQILRIHEFLHPRLPEIADALPASLGRWLLRSWARRLVERLTGTGHTVETTSITGFLLLYLVRGLRHLRRRSLRFAVEQARIDAWLADILSARTRALSIAIAQCQQLVKGYGDTHARGIANFETLMSAQTRFRDLPDAAERLSRLRRAALADDSGTALRAAVEELAP